MKDRPIRSSRSQRQWLYGCRVGVGVLIYKSGPNEVTEIEFCHNRQGELVAIATGKPILPLTQHPEED